VDALNFRPWTTIVSRFDRDGGHLWSRLLGTPLHGNTGSSPIGIDSEGGIYAGFAPEGPPDVPGMDAGPFGSASGAMKLDPLGNTVWTRTYATSGVSAPVSMANDPCGAHLFLGGLLGYLPQGSSLTFPGVDGASIDLYAEGGISSSPIDMYLVRLAP
jgi:hypothetical protein